MKGLIIKGESSDWEVVIGLEVHAQINSNSKLFSDAITESGSEPNSQVSLVDAAMPGMLPVLNLECVKQTIKTGLGIKAKINKCSIFDRKNYFYADLPQGYQISQFSDPIVGEGNIEIELDQEVKGIGIERIHIEQDAGKSIHDQSPQYSFIDLNRVGVGLMEIVSKPDLRSGEQAVAYIKKLRNIMRYLGTCDGDMEKGSLRCDANVSVRKMGDNTLGTRCEIKNLNSMKFLLKAVNYEANRQVKLLEADERIVQETRLYNSNKDITVGMRSKEFAHDYRYFPEPDLLPLVVSDEFINAIKETLPELPDEKRKRYVDTLGMTEYDATVLTSELPIANYFEEVVALCQDPKLVVTWVSAELFGRLNKNNLDITASPVSPQQLAKLISLIENDIISGKIAKEVFDIMFATGKEADLIVKEKGLMQITNTEEIEKVINEVISNNADKVIQYKDGKEKLFGFFVGQVMKVTKGKANPKLVNDLLKNKLN